MPQGVANTIHPAYVRVPEPAGLAWNHEIRILGHPEEAEVDLAQQGSALEQQVLAELLTERPEKASQIEILLDQLWFDALRRGGFAAEIGQLCPVGKRRKRDHQRSFSTTFHRLLIRPLLGARGSIDSSVLRSRTFRSNRVSRPGRTPRRSSSTPTL
jgi:hypothetical protein